MSQCFGRFTNGTGTQTHVVPIGGKTLAILNTTVSVSIQIFILSWWRYRKISNVKFPYKGSIKKLNTGQWLWLSW